MDKALLKGPEEADIERGEKQDGERQVAVVAGEQRELEDVATGVEWELQRLEEEGVGWWDLARDHLEGLMVTGVSFFFIFGSYVVLFKKPPPVILIWLVLWCGFAACNVLCSVFAFCCRRRLVRVGFHRNSWGMVFSVIIISFALACWGAFTGYDGLAVFYIVHAGAAAAAVVSTLFRLLGQVPRVRHVDRIGTFNLALTSFTMFFGAFLLHY